MGLDVAEGRDRDEHVAAHPLGLGFHRALLVAGAGDGGPDGEPVARAKAHEKVGLAYPPRHSPAGRRGVVYHDGVGDSADGLEDVLEALAEALGGLPAEHLGKPLVGAWGGHGEEALPGHGPTLCEVGLPEVGLREARLPDKAVGRAPGRPREPASSP
jgi:hypothetical protein